MERAALLSPRREEARDVRLLAGFGPEGSRQTARRRRAQSSPHENFRRCANARSESQKPAAAGKSPERQDAGLQVAPSQGPASPEAKKFKDFPVAAGGMGKSRVDLRE